jgi:fumarylpyruvate hydrolase
MSHTLFPIAPAPTLAVVGEPKHFPVHRVFCVGRNYAEHAKEMGFEVDREAPFYFMKSPSCITHTGSTVAYPLGTKNCHYEMEFVIAIGAPAFRISKEDALKAVYGYACGIDLTRRDLQISSREKGRPWDFGKNFEESAIIAPITKIADFGKVGPQAIRLQQNGTVKQDSKLSELIWSVEELISNLSTFYHLLPGDLIYTGTPAGVGAVQPGDKLFGEIDGLTPISMTIGAAQ